MTKKKSINGPVTIFTKLKNNEKTMQHCAQMKTFV